MFLVSNRGLPSTLHTAPGCGVRKRKRVGSKSPRPSRPRAPLCLAVAIGCNLSSLLRTRKGRKQRNDGKKESPKLSANDRPGEISTVSAAFKEKPLRHAEKPRDTSTHNWRHHLVLAPHSPEHNCAECNTGHCGHNQKKRGRIRDKETMRYKQSGNYRDDCKPNDLVPWQALLGKGGSVWRHALTFGRPRFPSRRKHLCL